MDDLVRWLSAQLDEDERIARAVHGPVDGPLGKTWWTPEEVKTRLCDDQIHMSDAQHIAAWDPARVLREIEAKQRILVEHRQTQPRWCAVCDVPGDYQGREYACTTVRLLALPYADRPGYREEWRP